MSVRKSIAIGALALSQVFAVAPAARAQSGNFALELNKAADVDGTCRLTYVATNNTGIALTKTSYEVAIFDGNGQVSSLLILEFGALPVAKTKVVQFDLKSTPCGDISRIVVNSLAACEAADGTHDDCMSALITSSKTKIKFGV